MRTEAQGPGLRITKLHGTKDRSHTHSSKESSLNISRLITTVIYWYWFPTNTDYISLKLLSSIV